MFQTRVSSSVVEAPVAFSGQRWVMNPSPHSLSKKLRSLLEGTVLEARPCPSLEAFSVQSPSLNEEESTHGNRFQQLSTYSRKSTHNGNLTKGELGTCFFG